MEIEKRYEIKGKIPQQDIESKTYIEQTYSVVMTDTKPDVRIRKTEQNGRYEYTHTTKYKTKNKNSRIEIEQNISKDEYESIFKIIDKKPLRKNRYILPLENGLIAEIDQFLDKDLIIVEIEFPDLKTMNQFKKPNWIGKEIKELNFSSILFSKINNPCRVELMGWNSYENNEY